MRTELNVAATWSAAWGGRNTRPLPIATPLCKKQVMIINCLGIWEMQWEICQQWQSLLCCNEKQTHQGKHDRQTDRGRNKDRKWIRQEERQKHETTREWRKKQERRREWKKSYPVYGESFHRIFSRMINLSRNHRIALPPPISESHTSLSTPHFSARSYRKRPMDYRTRLQLCSSLYSVARYRPVFFSLRNGTGD